MTYNPINISHKHLGSILISGCIKMTSHEVNLFVIIQHNYIKLHESITLIEPNEVELTLQHHKVRTASVPNSPQKIYRPFLHSPSALH
mgnify:CR=1 FL=1